MKCIEFYFILKIKTGSALESQLQISVKLKVVLSDLLEVRIILMFVNHKLLLRKLHYGYHRLVHISQSARDTVFLFPELH